ncbi:MAG: hypothetical protein EXS36_19990 [Pedosphaera sp.]|nr:hypothetical protein [Pedosphaera sp.]
MAGEFRQGQWGFRQLARSGGLCLYVKTKAGASGGLIESWEVIYPKHEKARVLDSGRSDPARERYPKDEDWGTWGWTYLGENDARRAFARKSDELANSPSNVPMIL